MHILVLWFKHAVSSEKIERDEVQVGVGDVYRSEGGVIGAVHMSESVGAVLRSEVVMGGVHRS